MTSYWQEFIQEHLHDAVRAALATVFGTASIEFAALVPGGASGAIALQLRVRGRSYLLRVEGKPGIVRNPHQYRCMQIAADAGIAPRLYHADERAGVAIIDFIQQQPLERYAGGPLHLAGALGILIRELQSTSSFPSLGDYRAFVSRLLGHLQGVFAPGLLERHRERFERIQAALPWDSARHVSCHNDPNSSNVLFDGKRLWLIDWETAYRNDPLLDIAILADNYAPSPELQEALLHGWHGSAPDCPTLARLNLMQLLSRLYYAGLLLTFAGLPPGSIADLHALSPQQFRDAVSRGELAPTAPQTRIVLGKMYLAGFLLGRDTLNFEELLRVAT